MPEHILATQVSDDSKIAFIFLDFDGCLLSREYFDRVSKLILEEIYGDNKEDSRYALLMELPPVERIIELCGQELEDQKVHSNLEDIKKQAFFEANKALFSSLAEKYKDFSHVVIVPASSRWNPFLDKMIVVEGAKKEAIKAINFLYLDLLPEMTEKIAEEFKAINAPTQVLLDPIRLAHFFRNTGDINSEIKKTEAHYESSDRYERYVANSNLPYYDDFKLIFLFMLLKYAARNPAKKIVCHLFDDRRDILAAIKKLVTADADPNNAVLSKNVELVLQEYSGKLEELEKIFFEMQGQGSIPDPLRTTTDIENLQQLVANFAAVVKVHRSKLEQVERKIRELSANSSSLEPFTAWFEEILGEEINVIVKEFIKKFGEKQTIDLAKLLLDPKGCELPTKTYDHLKTEDDFSKLWAAFAEKALKRLENDKMLNLLQSSIVVLSEDLCHSFNEIDVNNSVALTPDFLMKWSLFFEFRQDPNTDGFPADETIENITIPEGATCHRFLKKLVASKLGKIERTTETKALLKFWAEKPKDGDYTSKYKEFIEIKKYASLFFEDSLRPCIIGIIKYCNGKGEIVEFLQGLMQYIQNNDTFLYTSMQEIFKDKVYKPLFKNCSTELEVAPAPVAVNVPEPVSAVQWIGMEFAFAFALKPIATSLQPAPENVQQVAPLTLPLPNLAMEGQ